MKKLYTTLLLLLTASTISSSQVPTLQWVRQTGSGLNDYATSMAVDAAGNVYTTGYFNGTVDFNPGIGVYNLSDIGYNTCFLSKTDASGNFVWANIVTQESNFTTPVLTIDNIGNVYVTGGFIGTTDFDPGADSTILTSVGSPNVYIAKYSGEGKLRWAKNIGGNSMGGNSACNGTGIAIDGDGNVITTGKFAYGTTDFDPGQGVNNLTAEQADYFVSKLDSAGNFVWAKQILNLSGLSEGATCKISIDAAGNIYLGGTFTTKADFDPGSGVHIEKTEQGGPNIFICKLTASGEFTWVRNIGSYYQDLGYAIKVDASGNVYVTGSFRDNPDFDPDSTEQILYSSGMQDIFVLKLDSNGKYQWAKKMGGSQSDAGYSLEVDRNGNVYTAGLFIGIADFDPGSGVHAMTASGNSDYISITGASDIFISKLDPNGNYLWARQLGNSRSVSIGIDATDALYVAGTISGVGDFDPGVGQRYLSSEGEADIFILKLREVSVGVNEEGIADGLTLYPSPINGAATVQFGKTITTGTLRVLNILGQTIIERTELSGESCTIDLYNQASGMYIVELTSEGEVRRRNLVKE